MGEYLDSAPAAPPVPGPTLLRKRRGEGLGWAPWLALAVLAGSLGLTFRVWAQARASARQEIRAYFDFRARDALSRMTQRLATYEQVLRGVRGLFYASDQVSRREFSAYVASLNLEEHHPGIQGLGYAALVPRAKAGRHVEAIRREGFPTYTLWPPGERDPLSAIVYLEPFSGRNLRAFGYDMYSEPVRREAMARAWQTGATALSAKVTLVQETGRDVQSGFLMYLPVYAKGGEPGRNLEGWVYVPFRMADFMADVLGERAEDLDVEIYDRGVPGLGTLMYDRDPGHAGLLPPPGLGSRHVLEFGGHRWTVAIRALPRLEARLRRDSSIQVLIVGSLGSLLAATLVWGLALGRERALALAEARKLQVEAQRLHHQGAIGTLAKGLAHDFNNLMQSILSWVYLARLNAEPGGKVAQALDHVEVGSAQARELSERLHLLSDAPDLLDSQGPVAPLLQQAVAEALAGSAVQARFELEAADGVVRHQATQLQAAFTHVAINAREAMEGQGNLVVSLRQQVFPEGEDLPVPNPGPYLDVAFADTGPGIDPAVLPLIFEPYVSTKQTFSKKGLGLGLALCRIIMQRHGGAITAESRRGGGATIHLYLPLAPEEGAAGHS
ncbi:MAG TPA: CHASE domain-containing protein [Geothrix sp.]|nr:CHASE domain-containing protein [Geothrix sp.]